MALLRNVQVQASACVDEVAFLFMGGTPGWSAAYRSGPLTEDPSGRPVAVAGSAHLVIGFRPAAGADLSADQPVTVYDGPTAMRPAAPSGVAAVTRLGDFEGVATWAIGLSDRRPFEVVARGEQLVVRLAPATPRSTRCSVADAGASIGYPPGWYAELSERWACRYFDPEPFVIHPATDATSWTVTVAAADVPAAEVVSRMESGEGATVSTKKATVAGLPATVLDVTSSGQGLYPAGYQYRMYVVDTGAHALTIAGAAAPPGPRTVRNQAGVDRIAGLVRTG